MATITVSDCFIKVTALLKYFDVLYHKGNFGWKKGGGGNVPP